MDDGLYRVVTKYLCAGFVIKMVELHHVLQYSGVKLIIGEVWPPGLGIRYG